MIPADCPELSVKTLCQVRLKSLFLFSPDDGSSPDRIAQIMGPPDQAQHAADIISDLLRSVQAGGPPGHGGGRGRGRGQGNWNMGPPGGLQEFTFTVPTMKTGLIIGKGRWQPFFLFFFLWFNASDLFSYLFCYHISKCTIYCCGCLLSRVFYHVARFSILSLGTRMLQLNRILFIVFILII